MTLRQNLAAEAALAQSICDIVGVSPTLKVYTGTQPAVDAAPTGTLLVSITLDTGIAASSGVVALNPGNSPGIAVASGTAGWARLGDSLTSTHYMDGSAGVSGTDFILNTANIVSGVAVTALSLAITSPAN